MPTGQYARAKRGKGCYNVTEEWRERMRENAAKAREASYASETARVAHREAGKKVAGKKVARAILKAFPAGAKAGDVVRTSNRRFTVLDPVPVECADGSGKWEQKFHQDGRFTVYGVTKVFKGPCRLVWEQRPNMNDLLTGCVFEQEEEPVLHGNPLDVACIHADNGGTADGCTTEKSADGNRDRNTSPGKTDILL